MTMHALSTPTNLDFETGTIGDVPDSWASPTRRGGYTVRLTDEAPKHGHRCVEIAKTESDDSRETPFGNVMQVVDATPFRGKRLRFSGWARVQSVLADWLRMSTSRAQAWFRVDKSLGTIGFKDNMQDRPIRSRNWTRFEIIGDVATDAEQINLGLILQGKGKAWLDDVQIEILGAGGQGNQPAGALSARQLNNILALTRLVGYVRFFHPTKTVKQTDWDLFTINAIRHVENADSPAALAQLLNDVFNPVAPSVQIDVSGTNLRLPASMLKGLANSDVRFWQHRGVNLDGSRSPYSSKQRIGSNAHVSLLPPIKAELEGGVVTLVPTTVPTKDSSSYEGSVFKKLRIDGLPSSWQPSSDDRSSRLASVILAWNVIQHFYPYFDVVDTDWYAELKRALIASATDENESAFYATMERLIASLQDGHGGVIPNDLDTQDVFLLRHVPPPIALDWVGDSIVVTAIGQDVNDGPQVGDVITEIGGQSIEANMTSIRDRISAATLGQLRFSALGRLIIGPHQSSFSCKVRSPTGQEKEITLMRKWATDHSHIVRESRPEQGTEFAEGVIYVDLTRRQGMHEFTRLLPKLAKARGIVFDVRGYAGFEYRDVISYLIDEPVTSAQWHLPLVHKPDHHDMKFEFSNWQMKPKSPRFTQNVAFVTDKRAISASETLLGMVKHYKLGEIVGEATAGTNGDINPFTVPCGFKISWTGLRVLKHDGSQHHGIGIQPTIPVTRTIEGIKAGRDEFLEAAFKAVTQNVEAS